MLRLVNSTRQIARLQNYHHRPPMSIDNKNSISVHDGSINTRNNFIPHVYGMELKSHVFPHYRKNMMLS